MKTDGGYKALEDMLIGTTIRYRRMMLPEKFNIEKARLFLETPSFRLLDESFQWKPTPQGEKYWEEIANGCDALPPKKVPEEAIICIQNWIIEFLDLAEINYPPFNPLNHSLKVKPHGNREQV